MVPFTGDRGFESISLQRGVRCEPDYLDQVCPMGKSPARKARTVGRLQPRLELGGEGLRHLDVDADLVQVGNLEQLRPELPALIRR